MANRWERSSVYFLVFLPWLVLYEGVERLGTPGDARLTYIAWDYTLPIIPWTEVAYAGTYVFVLLAPLVVRRSRDLREFAVSALVATAVIIPIYLLAPLVAPAKPVVSDGLWGMLLRAERAHDGPITAFPAFHAVWALLAARAYAHAMPRWRLFWWILATAMVASCVTTGMHAVADVAAGLVVTRLVIMRAAIWRSACGGAERIANSWREWTIGPVRIMNHGAYAGAGAVAGLLVAGVLAGPSSIAWLAGMAIAAVIGAALWAQVVEGSPVLLRPYGYFGAVTAAAGVVLVPARTGAGGRRLFVAFGIGSTVTYAFGRVRCLVQGCCHGRATGDVAGIRYRHPRSRIVRLSELGGVPIHPTPLYSLLWMLGVGAACLRLWFLAAPLTFIAGVYFILTGLCRFVEEHYRGEPQTREWRGLRLYQWWALAFVLVGASLTAVPSEPAPDVTWSVVGLPTFCAVGVLVSALYGLDFPRSVRRFSRLG